jgi:predicted alpha/beta superfamily hydrolase
VQSVARAAHRIGVVRRVVIEEGFMMVCIDRWLRVLAVVLSQVLLVSAQAGPILTLRVTVPAGTRGPVYVSGSHAMLGPWKPDAVKLVATDDARVYEVALPLAAGTELEFKFTRGDWGSVEKAADGEELPNRRHRVKEANETVELEVAAWSDSFAPATRRSTVVGELRLHEKFESKALGNARTIRVWLPPGYEDEAGRRYPVLYFHDGQNLFDAATSGFGHEWKLDEAATRLIGSGRIRPVIIVGIDNTAERMSEYTADKAGALGDGKGGDYVRFVVGELKPLIDRTYRTEVGREHTFTGGSSLGGLVSLQLLREHPEVFGAAAVVSPALWWADEGELKRWTGEKIPTRTPVRVFVSMGTAEGPPGQWGDHVKRVERLRDALLRAGGVELTYRKVEGAEHNERAWAELGGERLEAVVGR